MKAQRDHMHVRFILLQFAIDNGWTSSMYPEAMQRSDFTQEHIQKNEIKPVCSSFNLEIHLNVFHENRRRGTGVVSRSMADQSMKAVSNQRSQEISKQLSHFQTPQWTLENPESMLTVVKVLRNQAIINLIKAFGRRQTADNQSRCVDTKKYKEHSSSDELLSVSIWAFKLGTTEHFRILSMLTLGRTTAFKSENILAQHLL